LHRGYVCLWRKIEDSAIFRDSHAYHLFSYLLVKAQYQDEKYSCTFKGYQIYLQRGQVITGRYELSKALNMPPSTVRDTLQRLCKKYGAITLKSDNKATIITLLNWDTYQNGNSNPDTQTTSRRHQPDTKQEGNKEKKEKNLGLGSAISKDRRTKRCYDPSCGLEVPEKDFNRHMTHHRINV
jgi:hypothetical protein